MYVLGFMFIGFQYTVADVYHIDIVSPVTGEPIKSSIVGYLQIDEFNERTTNIVTANFTTNSTFYDRVETAITAQSYVIWELIALITGTYPFWMLALFGIDQWFVTMLVSIYAILVARSVIGWLRGV